MKCVITGNPEKGLGKAFAEHFKAKGYDITFIRSKDDDKTIAKKIQNCDVFVNNAYGEEELQSRLLVGLKDFTRKMIVVGSMASVFPDPKNFKYTNSKRTLQNVFYNKCSMYDKNKPAQLLLSISGSAYNDPALIMRSVDFWLDNPEIHEIKFSQSSTAK